MLTHQTPPTEVIIACEPNALTAEQQARWMEVGPSLYRAIEEIKELPDGYAFRLPANSAMLMLLAEDLDYERLCCPFIHYAIEAEPNQGPFVSDRTDLDSLEAAMELTYEVNERFARSLPHN